MSSPSTRDLIQSLSDSEEFLIATGYSIGVVRMQDQELVLRFLAFRLAYHFDVLPEYSGNMDRFLDHAIDVLNDAPDELLDSLHKSFIIAMENAAHLFGDYAFRKCLPEHLERGARRRLINSSLFTTWSQVLADYRHTRVRRIPYGDFSRYLAAELEDDAYLYDCVTSGTNDRRRIFYALSKFKGICREHI
jgi:hypothetical protein